MSNSLPSQWGGGERGSEFKTQSFFLKRVKIVFTCNCEKMLNKIFKKEELTIGSVSSSHSYPFQRLVYQVNSYQYLLH